MLRGVRKDGADYAMPSGTSVGGVVAQLVSQSVDWLRHVFRIEFSQSGSSGGKPKNNDSGTVGLDRGSSQEKYLPN